MIKYPSIDQFRNVVKAVGFRTNYDGKDETGKAKFVPRPQPTLKFRGTTKLHGTNASIVRNFRPDGEPYFAFQSRERELSLEQDNAGFMLAMLAKEQILVELFNRVRKVIGEGTHSQPITIYGEWAGSNIQKGVAISGLPKFFAIFGVRVGEGDETVWYDIEQFKDIEYREDGIFNILTFGSWEVDIDFERPLEIQNHLGELTLAVEKECPAGKFFGNSGVGEGIVWKCITPGWESPDYQFKVKGEEHSASKVKTLAKVDTEAVRAIADFVEYAVTDARLTQGAQNLVREQGKPFEMTSMGDFIKWVYSDVIKEESDTIVANQLDPKKLGGPIANKARQWFIARFNEGANFSA